MNAFDIGFEEGLDKVAGASNPAQPVKSSLPGGAPEKLRFAPYLNQGGGQAAEHKAGPVESKPQPCPGHVNIGDKSPGVQVAGDVGGRAGSPDTGDLGMGQSGDQTVTKSAAFMAGALSQVIDDE